MMTPTGVQDYLTTSSRIATREFVFLVCQQGSEGVIKQFLLYPNSPFRLAFSRPGLLTFKVSGRTHLPVHPLIRLAGWVLGQVSGDSSEELIQKATELVGNKWKHLHVFERDRYETGQFGFEPGPSPVADEIARGLQTALGDSVRANQTADLNDLVLDCVVVDPNRWIMGWHPAEDTSSCWPGGVFPVAEPEGMISRAYLKMAEALAWSGLPIEAGDQIVEIGSAPGGASQRLLDMGMFVTGVDPAEMDPLLLQHPRFEHWRSKTSAVKRRNYAKFKWLVADANVAPNYTLDCVGDIAVYPTSNLQGLILTLKLSSYELLDQLDDYLDRISSWGFSRVKVRQLGHNRHEVCVVAAR